MKILSETVIKSNTGVTFDVKKGQIIRVIGAATKTAFGIYPKGNTGGSDVYFFKPMPIPEDLRAILDKSRTH